LAVNGQGEQQLSGGGDGVVVWPSLHLRIVGLCNLIGLLAQVAVGVGTLLPASMDGIMLEILALNHFCLFAQVRTIGHWQHYCQTLTF